MLRDPGSGTDPGRGGPPPAADGFHVDDEDLGRLLANWGRLAECAATLRERVTRLAMDTGVRAAQTVAADAVARAAADLAAAQRLGSALADALHTDIRTLAHSRDAYQEADRQVRHVITEIRHGLREARPGPAHGDVRGEARGEVHGGHSAIRGVLGGHHDAAPPPRPVPPTTVPVLPSPHQADDRRAVIIARARQWVDDRVGYDPGGSHDGYRTDCSGYVSMAWGLPESLTTDTLSAVCHPIGTGELLTGDVLLDTAPGPAGHVVLFDHWAAAHGSYQAYELTPAGTRHHVVPYPYFAGHGAFAPYRYDELG